MPSYLAPIAGSSYSEAYAEALATARTDRVLLATYELRHSAFVDEDGNPYAPRIVNNFEPLDATLEADAPLNPGETVRFEPLSVQDGGMAENDSGQAQTDDFGIDGVSGVLAAQFDRALTGLEPVLVTRRIYVSDDTSGPAILPVSTMTLRDGNVTDTRVSAKAYFFDPGNRAFPRKEYTIEQYPGLSES